MRNLFEKIQREKKILSFYSILSLFFYLFSVFYWLGYRLKILIYQSGMVKPKKLAILTRGYRRRKRKLTELVGENKNRIPWTEVGDEPYQLVSRLYEVPVMVSKDRGTSGVCAEKKYQAEVLVLDDGFQHWRLSRDLDIVVIDATNPFGNSRLFPAGILREPLSSLKRADIFVLNKADQIANKQNLIRVLRASNQDAPIIESVYKVNSVEKMFDPSSVDDRSPFWAEGKKLQDRKVLAFSGIGNPFSFEKSLKLLNLEVLRHRKFPDHFFYQKKDILSLEKEAFKLGADFMITTEKDSVRIPMMSELKIPIYVFKIDLMITKGEEIFLEKIEESLNYGNKD